MMGKEKNALPCIWKVIQSCYEFTQLHPVGFKIAVLFLLFYLVCPVGFKAVTYAIGIFYAAAIIIKVIANSETSQVAHEFPPLKSDSSEGAALSRKYKKPTISTQMSKRRNFKIRREDLDTADDAERKQDFSSLHPDDNLVNEVTKDLDPQGVTETKLEASSSPSDENSLVVGGAKVLGAPVDPGIKQVDASSAFDEYLVNQNAKLEQKNEEMSTVKGFIVERGESSCPSEPVAGKSNQSKEGSPSQLEVNDSSEEAEDDDEEDLQEERNPAVEWTEDDQKSLMDIGLSELERNKRLENLIAKRRARKTTSMKVQQNFLDLDISHPGSVPPLNISKNPFVQPNNSGDTLESQLPGSAPSVLLPARNPFDLPYEPNEEKPNLTLDGFNADILAPQPKDIFCRHESFYLGSSFSPEIDEDIGDANFNRLLQSEKRNVREPRYSRFKWQSDKGHHDWLVEQVLYKPKDPKSEEDASRTDAKGGREASDEKLKTPTEHEETTSTIHGNLKDSPDERVNDQQSRVASTEEDTEQESTSSLSEDHEETVQVDRSMINLETELAQTMKNPNISLQESSPHLVKEPPCENGCYAAEYMDRRSSHTPTFSVASDMQVEISGTSTPRNLADYNTSPADVEFSTYDRDMERQTGFSNNEIWGALLKRNDISTLELPEDHGEGDSFKGNNTNMNNNNIHINNPFGSYISLHELDRQDLPAGISTSLQQKEGRYTVSSEGSSDNDPEVDNPSGGNKSEPPDSKFGNNLVPPTPNQTHSKQAEEVKKEGQ